LSKSLLGGKIKKQGFNTQQNLQNKQENYRTDTMNCLYVQKIKPAKQQHYLDYGGDESF